MDKQLKYQILLDLRNRMDAGAKEAQAALDRIAASATGINRQVGQLGGRTSVACQSMVNSFKQANTAIDSVAKGLTQVSYNGGKLGGVLPSVATATRQFNGLNFSVQQVARELPSLAISANTFFLAISNNLPILADNIKAVRMENQRLAASGQKTVPVWKQVAGSLFSWQTAMVAGVTVLSMYGREIVQMISNTFRSSSALNAEKNAQETLNEARRKGVTDAQGEIAKLRVLYTASQDETRSKKERLSAIQSLKDAYPDYFGSLQKEEILAGKATTAYQNLTKSLIDVATARASLDRITENAGKLIDLNDQKDKLSTEVRDAEEWLEGMASRMGSLTSQSEQQMYASTAVQVTRMKERLQSVTEEINMLNTANEKLTKNINVSALADPPGGRTKKKEEENTNLATLGGIENKIKNLQSLQAKASEGEAIALEKEIRLWQEKLNLMQKAVIAGVEGNLAKQGTSLLEAPVIAKQKTEEIRIPVRFDTATLARSWQIMKQQYSDALKEAEITGQQISSALSNGIQTMASSLGEALASGSWAEAMKGMLIGIMGMLQEFASALIAAGVATLAFQSMFLNPIGAIVAGTALMVAVSVAKAALQNATAFAAGGIVSGPTLALVGEYSGASNNPEVIAPLNKLRSMIEPANGGLGDLRLEARIHMKELYIALRGVERERRRTR